jgi:arginine deiminase
MLPYNIHSEVAPLKKVLLYKPGLGLERLTQANYASFLFDDVLNIEKAQKEHEIFQLALEKKGVEVFLLNDLLLETLNNPEAKQWLIDQRIKIGHYGESLSVFLREYFSHLSSAELIKIFTGGLVKKELKKTCNSLVFEIFSDHQFILLPLPNHFFVRDTSSWIANGVSVNHMVEWCRRPETLQLKCIYQFHPMFSKEEIPLWYDGIEQMSAIEGGDILVIGKGVLLVGMSERTTPQAIEILSQALFLSGKFKEVIAVQLPRKSEFMHLDTVITMLDDDAFIVYESILKNMMVWRIRPDECHSLVIERKDNLFQTVALALGIDALRIFTTGGDAHEAMQEQRKASNNLLAVSPGIFLSYEHNMLTNTKLRQAGFEVIEVPGVELSKGRGGVRCMSCPLLREIK